MPGKGGEPAVSGGKGGEPAVLGGKGGEPAVSGGREENRPCWGGREEKVGAAVLCQREFILSSFQPSSPSRLERHPSRGETCL